MFADREAPNMPNSQIDDSSPENLKKLRMFGETILEENAQRFDDLCNLLVMERDKRIILKTKDGLKDRIVHFFRKSKVKSF